MNWVALKTIPVARAEFRAEFRVLQQGFPVMLPYEILYEKKPGKREPIKIRHALFPRYVFAGLGDVEADYDRLKRAIPEIQGIVSRSRDDWSPLLLTPADVSFVASLVERTSGATSINLHKALAPGKSVEVSVGGTVQETKIQSMTRKGVRVLLQMLGSMHSVEVPFDAVRAA